MPAIGYVARSKNGNFKGQLKTLTIKCEIDVVANAKKAKDRSPDFRVTAGEVEIGAD